MEELIETGLKTLIWENICHYIEETIQAPQVLNGIGYIDHLLFEEIEKAETLVCDEFNIEKYQEENNTCYISFYMPIVLMFYNSHEQILRVTMNVLGSCVIPNIQHYQSHQYDFDNMNRLQLLSYKDLITDIQCTYHDVECDDLREA